MALIVNGQAVNNITYNGSLVQVLKFSNKFVWGVFGNPDYPVVNLTRSQYNNLSVKNKETMYIINETE